MLEDSPIAGDLPIDTLKLVADRGTSNYIDRLDLELISGIDISDTKKEIGALADLAGQCDDTQLDRLRGIVNEILALAQPRLPDDMTVDDVISAIKSYFSAIELIGGASSKIDFMTIPRIKACIKKSQEVIEKACEQGDRSNIKKLTNAYLGLSFLQLEIRDFNGALISSERGAALNPDYLPIYTNYAHALLFLGRVDEAKSVYLEHKGKPLQGKTWEAVILDDFAIFEKVGLSSPEMVQVRKLMDQ